MLGSLMDRPLRFSRFWMIWLRWYCTRGTKSWAVMVSEGPPAPRVTLAMGWCGLYQPSQ